MPSLPLAASGLGRAPLRALDEQLPIGDETVWFPRGMLIGKHDQKLNIKPHDPRDRSDDEQIFILERGQMHALCRFLWTGKLLPTDRTQDTRYLGLVNTSVISTEISEDCIVFKDETWDKLTILADIIKTYAVLAGGTGTSSYYQAMLEWVGQYNDEKDKPAPDQTVLDNLSKSIKGAIDDEQKKITLIQDQVAKALDALGTFHDNCKVYGTTLQGDGNSLQGLLNKEGNNIDKLQAQIDQDRTAIEDAQARIGAGEVLAASVPIGTIASAIVANQAQGDIEKLERKIKDVQKALDAEEAKVSDLVEIIAPAILTLEALQGAWAGMSADLQTLYDLFGDSAESIPPMLLEQRQLETIVEYIENSFMTDEPKHQSMQEWLDDAEKYLGEAKARRAKGLN
ncbi:hypothetical protein BBK36DRAFT_1180910 [Trichoderma citrinoviride]|uniref:Uncharacterized protein n=1 Tax=Trichoderma citrinoviride TaxID=58853 RepID=A0A2T4B3W3_9HYPO|nr:hypothetical protein BBK36DRAFT_1180910 [Trichoderma citrinoviride]PTB63928.1 hypothetical protein BBK36DRAFT_1180910 [Trichoderma citrinoviride]